MKKSVNLIMDEEIKRLKHGIINAVNDAKLPVSVTCLVIVLTAHSLIAALQKIADNERNTYNRSIKEDDDNGNI